MEAKEEITKLSNNINIIGAYDYKKHLEQELKQIAKESVKDDLVKIEEGKKFIEENTKILEERKKSLEEGQKSLEEDKKPLRKRKKNWQRECQIWIYLPTILLKQLVYLKNKYKS